MKEQLYTIPVNDIFDQPCECPICSMRNRLDEETVISAIKNYAASADKDLNLLAEYASQFGVEKVLKRYMEVLL